MKRQICIKLVKTIGIWGAVVLVYLLLVRRLGWGIPCVFRTLLGVTCPGCGMTRALEEVLKGNFRGAWEYNALSLTVLPLTCIYLLYRAVREEIHRRSDKEFYKFEYVFLIGMLVITIAYAIMRNKNYI